MVWHRILRLQLGCQRTFKRRTAIKTLEQTTRFTGERYEVALLWREDEVKLPNNIYSAMGQLKSLERRPQKDDMLPKRYQETINSDVEAGYIRKVQQVELNETRDKLQWYLPHHPVINPHKPEKVRRVCNAAAKYQDVALNGKLLSGPDLLQSLIGIIFRFREHQIALSRHRSDVSSSCCPKRWQPMPTISLARRFRAENRSLRVYTTRFWGEELADLCKLRFASSGKR